VFLSGLAREVHLVIRGDRLDKGMSYYLATRVEQTGNIRVHLNTCVAALLGDDHLEAVELASGDNKPRKRIGCEALFSFIGAVPRTEWLPAEILRDAKGFVLTGQAVLSPQCRWTCGSRPPYLLETSRPGVFAAGDVRAGSSKRVAMAVGEGATALQLVQEYLRHM
jgi:thioredoxin reductase (NADPH)